MIVYTEREPFGGLREDENEERETGWNTGIKLKFLSVNRKPGVYLYQKASGVPSHVLFLVSPNGDESYEYEPYTYDNIEFRIFRKPNYYEEDLLRLLWLVKLETNGVDKYRLLKALARKDLNTENMGDVFTHSTEKINLFLTTYFYNGHTLGTSNLKIDKNRWEAFKRSCEIRRDEGESLKVSKDVGIINPSFDGKGIGLSYFNKPTSKTLRDMGYELSTNKLSAKSIEKDGSGKYDDTTHLGRNIHDFPKDVEDALEASKGVTIGWAAAPTDLK
jgi:hypothetical protein